MTAENPCGPSVGCLLACTPTDRTGLNAELLKKVHRVGTRVRKSIKRAEGMTDRPYLNIPFFGAAELQDYQWMTNHIAPLR